MKIEAGKLYYNGRGDLIGPMVDGGIGYFIDQHNRVYYPNGRQWGHHPDSTGNIIRTIDESAAIAAGARAMVRLCQEHRSAGKPLPSRSDEARACLAAAGRIDSTRS